MTRPAARERLLERLGLVPSVQDVVRQALEAAVAAAEERGGRRPNGGTDSAASLAVLDAGCGRVSALRPFRSRIDRFVGADIHPPATPLPHLDEFKVVDLCTSSEAFLPGSFDVILSSFTLEHFERPPAALAHFRRWLRPGGTLVITTVNRRHPFVAAYLGAPAAVRNRLQPLVKATAADAHPLVGACNDSAVLADALRGAGFRDLDVTLVPHLARAWGRTLPTFAAGLFGDLLSRSVPDRRSTIVAVARTQGWRRAGAGRRPGRAHLWLMHLACIFVAAGITATRDAEV